MSESLPVWAEDAKSAYLKLKELDIKYEIFQHKPAKTIDDLDSIFVNQQKTLSVKNLFIHDKHKQYYVVSTISKKSVAMKTIEQQLSTTGCRLASREALSSILQLEPGAVTPLACINDSKHAVQFVFDAAFRHEKSKCVLVHLLKNTVTISLTVDELIKFVESTGHKIKWIDLDDEQTREPSLENTAPAKRILGTESLGITTKKELNFGEWYTQTIVRSEMVDYYDISGCYILRPWSFFLWECAQSYMDKLLKKRGVQNAYFPIFVTKNRLETEKKHVEGFSPEVAWVTRYGDSELAEPIALRPTSETIVYPSYARWIRSHRDLPLQLNQWCQVVRWEFKQPTPFIRTREFLWQEGHTAHATAEEAEKTIFDILDIYEKTYEDVFAVPVIKGLKSENEKFAGAEKTATIETFINENGRAVQAATTHYLGTNFSKMFRIEYEDKQGKKQYVHQTSWGYTTRSIGICVMLHGDNKGMVMPPYAAPLQVILIPILYKEDAAETSIVQQCKIFMKDLTEADIRCSIDERENYTPGWKYNDWEKKGVCIRIELGPRDMSQKTCRLVRRDTNEKLDVSWDKVVLTITELLKRMHKEMLERARARIQSSIVKVTEWKDVLPTVNSKKLILVPWCEDTESEEEIKKVTRTTDETTSAAPEEEGTSLTGPIKSICVPLDQPPMPKGTKCFFTQKEAKRWWIFGRSY